MKKTLKYFVIGVAILTLLMGTAIGQTITKTIEVVYNTVNITVNGQKIEADNILYNGVTYVPLRAVADALDKDVGWDQATMTASINDKGAIKPPTNKENEYVIKDANGKDLYSFKINKATTMSERNKYSDKKPAQVLLIDMTYKNIASEKEVYLSEIYFKVVDSAGKIGYTYPNSPTDYPQKVPVGVTCDSQMIFGIDNASETITLNFYKDMNDLTKSFTLQIE